jgi:hypothetical protein
MSCGSVWKERDRSGKKKNVGAITAMIYPDF